MLITGLILLGAVLLVAILTQLPQTSRRSASTGYGIQMTEEEVALERQNNEDVMQLLERAIVDSKLFCSNKVPDLVSKLRGGAFPFARVNTKIAFVGNVYLTPQQKKTLGLNTRMKYSQEFVNYFQPEALRTIEPKSVLTNMHLAAFHSVSRRKELNKFKTLGFVKHVTIAFAGGDSCNKVYRLKKSYSIDSVPELPVAGCDASFCACSYAPVLINFSSTRPCRRPQGLTHGSSGLTPFGCAGPSFHSGPGTAKWSEPLNLNVSHRKTPPTDRTCFKTCIC